MAKDRRKKGCPNMACIKNSKKIRQTADFDYCPKCGTKLVFVCEKCFAEIEDTNSKHRICKLCEVKAKEKNQKIVGGIKTGAKKTSFAVIGVTAPVVTGIVGKVVKDGQKGAIQAGVKIIENTAKTMLKK